MPEISVIVPVYKVEAYLSRCVNSILSQSYKDFELILVDDGSPDNCGTICDDYAQKDSRVHVIHQENRGLSAARNAGIDWAFANSKSEWITFIDSDDWVHPDYLWLLYSAATSNQCSISICNYAEVSHFHAPQFFSASDNHVNLFSPQSFYTKHTIASIIACAKLYRKATFLKIRFPVGKIHEDEFTFYKILFSQEQLVWIDLPLYSYFLTPDSITRSKWSIKHLDRLEALDHQLRYFRRNNLPIAFSHARNIYMYWIEHEYMELLSRRDQYPHEMKQLRKSLRIALLKYGSQTNRTIEKVPHLYELAFPKAMWIHWTICGIKSKILRFLRRS